METTVIREENREPFMPLMPQDLWQDSDLVLGAIEENCACGVIAVSVEDTLFNIKYLYVAEDYRRKGIATVLLQSLHEVADVVRVDATYCQFSENENMNALQECLSENYFVRDELDSPIYKVTLGDLPERLLGRAPKLEKRKLVPLSETTTMAWNTLLNKLEQMPNEEGTVPELDVRYVYDQDASFLLMNRSEVQGCILFEKVEDSYILSYFCVLGNVNSIEMMSLLQAAYAVLEKRATPETEIYINALTETTRNMVLNLAGEKVQEIGRAAEWFFVY